MKLKGAGQGTQSKGPKLSTKTVCDGVRIDKNIIPNYLQQVQAGTANYSIECAFYSGAGKRCQSGSCNKKIHNVYVVKDNNTDTTYEIGSECVKKYKGLTRLLVYWKTQLEKAKGKTMRNAKRAAWQQVKAQRAAKSQEEHSDDLAFIARYLEIKPSPFLESIEKCFNNGWQLSDKQAEVFENIKNTIDWDKMASEIDAAVLRFDDVLQLIERLDRVSFGQYPSNAFRSIRDQFARSGSVSEKQQALLEKLTHRFRRQIQR